MVDVFCVNHAAKLSWIRRLSGNNEEKWKLIMFKRMGTRAYQLNEKSTDLSITKNTTKFDKQILTSWLSSIVQFRFSIIFKPDNTIQKI